MGPKPDFIDLRSRSSDRSLPFPSPRLINSADGTPMPSPRLQHFAGDVPPALSPLDAFAAQGRALAKQLDEEQRAGRRASRLPHLSVAKSLSQPRPGYFRSLSAEQRAMAEGGSPVNITEVDGLTDRPTSQYPQLSGFANIKLGEGGPQKEDWKVIDTHDDLYRAPRSSSSVAQPRDYFDIRTHAETPERFVDRPEKRSNEILKEGSSRMTQEPSNIPDSSLDFGRLPQPRPAYMESSEDDYTSSNAGSTFSQQRKMSSSSGVSAPQSPLSPFVPPFPRSPSISSELSVGAPRLGRQTFNFSRPLSTSSQRLSLESSSKQACSDGNPPSYFPVDTPPANNPPDSLAPPEGQLSPGPNSYTYSKYSLPRGRMLSRNSIVFSGLQTPHFQWDGEILNDPSDGETSRGHTPEPRSVPLPSTPPTLARGESSSTAQSSLKSSSSFYLSDQRPSISLAPETERPREKFSFEVPLPPMPEPPRKGKEVDTSSSIHTDSTVRPRTAKTAQTAYDLSPDEHLTKAIECHENGSLKESTYHLRLAAKMNNPTGMLLYALACRHGWGMRPDPREGVQWLRKAVDCASVEVAEAETEDCSKPGDIGDRKARQTQFALSIYELGVSHLNGWGIEQDKALALRCFEIAGNWGDGDALAEAGFCYAQGIGCKKNMKKAAKFYRQAAAKGISMVGNSWIYKSKYDDDDDHTTAKNNTPTPEKRGRARTKSLFSRKKSGV